MSFQCDRCGETVERFGMMYRMSLDFRSAEPNNPAEAAAEKGHLCLECRDAYRNFLAGDIP